MTARLPGLLRALALAWAGKCLVTPPSNFERYAVAYSPFVSLRVVEWQLGLVCLLAGLAGVAGVWLPGWTGWGCRTTSSVCGAAVWTALLLAFGHADLDLLTLGPLGLAAGLCWRTLLVGERL